MSQYSLTAAELPVIRQLLALQKLIAVDAVPSPPYQTVSTLMDGLHALSNAYPTLANATYRGWVDQLYNCLIATPTCYGRNFPELVLAQRYGEYVQNMVDMGLGTWDVTPIPPETYLCFSKGTVLISWKEFDGQFEPNYPIAPPAWVAALNAVYDKWGTTPPVALIDQGPHLTMRKILPAQAAIVSSGWKDFDQVKTSMAPLWKSQLDAAQAMLSPANLGEEGYFFLLHLLSALALGPAAGQQFAHRLITARTDSPEYPNDTFLNQVVYLVLMSLANPRGDFAWTNAQLQQFTRDLAALSPGNDPVSTALRDSLSQHEKVLRVDTAYPMQDPDSPSIGFTQRKTDTLFALDKARADLREES